MNSRNNKKNICNTRKIIFLIIGIILICASFYLEYYYIVYSEIFKHVDENSDPTKEFERTIALAHLSLFSNALLITGVIFVSGVLSTWISNGSNKNTCNNGK